MSLTPELRRLQDEIEAHARDYGLDPFPVSYEVVDYAQISALAAYEGFPVRYPHWRFGMAFERLSKGSEYGLHRIYEMVINNNPCYAYLLENNAMVDQKIVMAHVCGHADFFKNNLWFSKTNRKMLDQMANHASRVRRHMDSHGVEEVERFIDTCLSIEDLIDFHGQFIARDAPPPSPDSLPASDKVEVKKLRSKDYMDDYINPPAFLASRRHELEMHMKERKKFPLSPRRDILLFLMEYAPLEDWQRDVLSVVRDEAYYFIPQRQTKIMNEGWAAYWHSKILTERALKGSELIDYADHHSGTVAPHPNTLNPYRLGLRLFEHIEERWNKGRFGKDYDQCDDLAAKRAWDQNLGLGRKKIFEVRRLYNDVTFLDEFLTPEFCDEHKMFTYEFNPRTGNFEIASRDFRAVKAKTLFMLTNGGNPIIELADANHGNRGELLLVHRHEGVDLHMEKAMKTLESLHAVWTRPVHVETVVEGEKTVLRYDGNEHATEAA